MSGCGCEKSEREGERFFFVNGQFCKLILTTSDSIIDHLIAETMDTACVANWTFVQTIVAQQGASEPEFLCAVINCIKLTNTLQ